MTTIEKNKIIDNIMELLIQLTDEDGVSASQTELRKSSENGWLVK